MVCKGDNAWLAPSTSSRLFLLGAPHPGLLGSLPLVSFQFAKHGLFLPIRELGMCGFLCRRVPASPFPLGDRCSNHSSLIRSDYLSGSLLCPSRRKEMLPKVPVYAALCCCNLYSFDGCLSPPLGCKLPKDGASSIMFVIVFPCPVQWKLSINICQVDE